MSPSSLIIIYEYKKICQNSQNDLAKSHDIQFFQFEILFPSFQQLRSYLFFVTNKSKEFLPYVSAHVAILFFAASARISWDSILLSYPKN